MSSPPPAGIKFNPGSSAVATASVQEEGGTLVPFHKLTQWLAYSLVVPLQTTLGWVVEGMEDMTGLPEYRNGENLHSGFLFWSRVFFPLAVPAFVPSNMTYICASQGGKEKSLLSPRCNCTID